MTCHATIGTTTRTCPSCRHIVCAGKCAACKTCDAVQLVGRPAWEPRPVDVLVVPCQPAVPQ